MRVGDIVDHGPGIKTPSNVDSEESFEGNFSQDHNNFQNFPDGEYPNFHNDNNYHDFDPESSSDGDSLASNTSLDSGVSGTEGMTSILKMYKPHVTKENNDNLKDNYPKAPKYLSDNSLNWFDGYVYEGCLWTTPVCGVHCWGRMCNCDCFCIYTKPYYRLYPDYIRSFCSGQHHRTRGSEYRRRLRHLARADDTLTVDSTARWRLLSRSLPILTEIICFK